MKLFTTSSSKNAKILRLSSIGIALLIVSALVIIVDPIQLIVDSQLALKAGSLLYNLWLKPPLDVFITVYVFNITNLDAFMRGIDHKLRVEEAGPYVYQEMLENNNVTFNENNTLSYSPRRTVKFIRERSVGDPKTDRIIAPNIPYMGVLSAVSSFSTFAAFAVNALTRRFNSKPMLEMSVHEYLWGYDDPLVHLASKIMPNVINFKRFGLMERMFDEGFNMVTIKLPEKGSHKAVTKAEEAVPESTNRDFSIDNWNGKRGFKAWDYHENENNTVCNTLRGTYDGTLFPRNIKKGDTFRVYRKAFCRTMPIVYSHPGIFNGIEGYNFKLQDNAFDSSLDDSETSCFCKNNVCLKKGLGNITPCYYNIPLAVSFPHFFNGDPSLLKSIDGLSPDPLKHGTEIVIQPQLGIPMRVHSRFQINLLMSDIKFNKDISRLSNTVVPIFWLEMSIEDLTPSLKLLLTVLFKVCPAVQIGIIVALILSSIYMVGTALLFCFWMPSAWTALNTKDTNSKEQQLLNKTLEATKSLSNICILPLLPKEITKRKQEYDAKLQPLITIPQIVVGEKGDKVGFMV